MKVLIKPNAEHSMNLVILMDNTESLSLVDVTTGEIIEQGRNSGASNSYGATFRFSKPGGNYQNVGLMDDKGNIITTLATAGDRIQYEYNDYDSLVTTPVSTIRGYRWDNSANINSVNNGGPSNNDVANMSSEEYNTYLENQRVQAEQGGTMQPQGSSTMDKVKGVGTAVLTEAAKREIVKQALAESSAYAVGSAELADGTAGLLMSDGTVVAGEAAAEGGTAGGAGAAGGSTSGGAAAGNASATLGSAGMGLMGVAIANHGVGEIENRQEGGWKGGARGASYGAGAGASIGTAIMPGMGTFVGAGIGAVIGGIYGAIRRAPQTRVEDEKMRKTVRDMLNAGYTEEQVVELVPGLKDIIIRDIQNNGDVGTFVSGKSVLTDKGRWEQLSDSKANFIDPATHEAITDDFVGMAYNPTTQETQWVNNEWLKTGDTKTLKAEDTWGYNMWEEAFGPKYFELDEATRRNLNQQALDEGLIKEGKGSMWFDTKAEGYNDFMARTREIITPGVQGNVDNTWVDPNAPVDAKEQQAQGSPTTETGTDENPEVSQLNFRSMVATDENDAQPNISNYQETDGATALALMQAKEQEELMKKQMAINMLQNTPSSQFAGQVLSNAFNKQQQGTDPRVNFEQLSKAFQ